MRTTVIRTTIRKHLICRYIDWQLVKLSPVTLMDNTNFPFLWGWNFLIFKVLVNYFCLFSGFLRFSGPLTPFSGFLRFLRLSGSASHPVLDYDFFPNMAQSSNNAPYCLLLSCKKLETLIKKILKNVQNPQFLTLNPP